MDRHARQVQAPRPLRWRALGRAILALVAWGLASSAPAQEQGTLDFADTFFRYTGTQNKAFFSELPGETVDPFTGNLQIIQEDLSLPGMAGLDLKVLRTYSSKLWVRADYPEQPMAENDGSILGYGWSLHFGRLRAPSASGESGLCGGRFPIYQEADGTSHVFYPVYDQGPGVFVSKDHWRLERNCNGQWNMTCVWSDTGTRYEFSQTSVDWRGDTRINLFWVGMTPFAPVTAVVDPFGNRISMTYLNATGAPDYVVDTYGRTLHFTYSNGVDGRRLISLEYNNKLLVYEYQTVLPEEVFGHAGRYALPGPRRFLTAVTPPAGPPMYYEYAWDVPVRNNQYALSSITYPAGGTTSYTYDAVPIFTGLDLVPFPVVTQRTVAGRGVPAADWTYSYSSPAYSTSSSTDPRTGLPTNLHVTTITRPDGKHDTYVMYGFGWVADQLRFGHTYAVGLTLEIARGDRSEVETYDWQPGPRISNAVYSAPIYGSSCGPHYVADRGVTVPVMTHRWIERDGALFETEYADFDAYGQPQTVVERGYSGGLDEPPPPAVRTTTTRYFYAETDAQGATLHMVRGRPLTQTVCIGEDCVDSSWRYDEPGHPLHAETRSGVTTTYDHALNGDLVRVTNALGQYVHLSDYAYGVPRSISHNGAFQTRRTVTWEGWVEEETNGRGYTTTTLHDAIGRPTRVIPPGRSHETEYTYAPDGASSTATRLGARPYQQTTSYDGLGRVVSTIDSEGVQTSKRYDTMGRAWFESYAYDAITGEVGDMLSFDPLGRVTLRTRAYRPIRNACDTPGACTVSLRYEANCIQTTVQRAVNDRTRSWSCNTSFGDPAEQRLAQVSDPMSSLWQYQHSTAGDLLTVTAPLGGGTRTYQYDDRQFLENETTPERGTTVYGRNAIGQVRTRTDARNITTTYHYNDPLGRLSGTTHSSGSADDVDMDYDNANNVELVSSPSGGRLEYEYDELDRVTEQTWTFGGFEYQTLFHYDDAGCLDSITYPTGTVLTLTCDAANRVNSIRMGGELLVEDVTYHPSGLPRAVLYGNDVSTTYGIDDRGRVASVTAPRVLDLRYGYDGADNVTSLDDSLDSTSARLMTYDANDRLRTVTAYGMWGLAQYEYDELGNRRRKQMLGMDVRYNYDASNRLEGTTEVPDHGTLTFTWDSEGRLASSSDGASYRYDGRGRRVMKADAAQTTLYHHDPSGRVIAETLPDGTKLRDYVYLGDKLIAVDGCVASYAAPCNDRQWYHTDTLGSVAARTDRSGAVMSRLRYMPWGEEWDYLGEAGDRQYNGRVYDAGTGFHDYGARMYWPQIGRFVSPDSDPGDIDNPPSLNLYSYVWNNPYKYTDPDGHSPLLMHLRNTPNPSVGRGAPVGVQGPTGVIGSRSTGAYRTGQFSRAAGRVRAAPDAGDAVGATAGQGSQAQHEAAGGAPPLHRPYLRKATVEAIEAAAPRDARGRPIDPNTGTPIQGKPDRGHVPGHEFRREKAAAEAEGLSQKQFNDRMNNPKLYQLENPSTNRSRRYEQKP